MGISRLNILVTEVEKPVNAPSTDRFPAVQKSYPICQQILFTVGKRWYNYPDDGEGFLVQPSTQYGEIQRVVPVKLKPTKLSLSH